MRSLLTFSCAESSLRSLLSLLKPEDARQVHYQTVHVQSLVLVQTRRCAPRLEVRISLCFHVLPVHLLIDHFLSYLSQSVFLCNLSTCALVWKWHPAHLLMLPWGRWFLRTATNAKEAGRCRWLGAQEAEKADFDEMLACTCTHTHAHTHDVMGQHCTLSVLNLMSGNLVHFSENMYLETMIWVFGGLIAVEGLVFPGPFSEPTLMLMYWKKYVKLYTQSYS